MSPKTPASKLEIVMPRSNLQRKHSTAVVLLCCIAGVDEGVTVVFNVIISMHMKGRDVL